MVKRRGKIILSIILVMVLSAGAAVAVVYAHMEPQSKVGGLYFRMIYDPDEKDLANLSAHLWRTNAGCLPPSLDAYVFGKLERAEKGSEEYINLLGFYAHQSKSSRAGSLIFEKGQHFLPTIMEMGREEDDEERKRGFLYLAYGVADGKEAYKPGLLTNPPYTLDEGFDYVERGELEKLGFPDL